MPAKKKMPTAPSIRWMIRRDMDAVLEIESAVEEFRWDLDVFLHHLRQRNVIGMVAEHEEQIVGFMVYALTDTRLQLLNLVVDPCRRRQGVGRQMIERMASKLSTNRRTRLVFNVHEGNLGLQLFLRAAGFRSDGICGEFYIMVRKLRDDDPAPVNRIAAFLE